MSELEETIKRLESALGLEDGFFDKLKSDDDWSFVIKTHALIETACTNLLSAYFSENDFKEIFSWLEMSNKKAGKIAFLKAAGLMISEEVKFVTKLSELRNRLIHNVHGINFSFSDYVSNLDKQQRKSFSNSFGYAYLVSDKNKKLVVDDPEKVLKNPKIAIWNGVKIILGLVKLQVETKNLSRDAEKSKLKIFELMQPLTKP